MLGAGYEFITAVTLNLPAFGEAVLTGVFVSYSGGMPDVLSWLALLGGGAAAGAAGGVAHDYPRPPPDDGTFNRDMGYSRYSDGDGNNYYPGISAIPEDGIVYKGVEERERWFPLGHTSESNPTGNYTVPSDPTPVDRDTGQPIYPVETTPPDGSTERPVSSRPTAARG